MLHSLGWIIAKQYIWVAELPEFTAFHNIRSTVHQDMVCTRSDDHAMLISRPDTNHVLVDNAAETVEGCKFGEPGI